MDYFIVFHDKSLMLVDKEFAEPMAAKKEIPDFNIDGNHYKGASVAAILTIDKYYELHPEKRPPTSKEFSGEAPKDWTPAQRAAVHRMTTEALWAEIQSRKERGLSTSIAEGIYNGMMTGKTAQPEILKSL